MSDSKWFRDEFVWETIKNKKLNNREAFLFCDIDPENYEKLKKKSPDLEKRWLQLTINMLDYYSISQLSQYIDNCISLKAEDVDKIFKKSQRKKFELDGNIDIIEIAKKNGLDVKKNMSVCPFHADGQPSLKFYPETNSFFCFGCRVGGDAIKFYQLLKNEQR